MRKVVEEAGRRAAGIRGAIKTRFECVPLSSQRVLKRKQMTTLLELLRSLGPSDAVVISTERGAPVSTVVAIAVSMTQRMRQQAPSHGSSTSGLRPLDLISQEPLPLTRKWNAPRGLLEVEEMRDERFKHVRDFVNELDSIGPEVLSLLALLVQKYKY